ncbi:MAG: flagellar basal body-associated FliL family protein [Spirochaetales bacterium]|jgi:flagellar FliL protein|nr:flagellar basal body-associated FliL family protein [Spirochaetales bacterium]
MSDENEMFDEGEGGDVGGEAQPSKKAGFLPSFVIQILKWAALGLGAIIFIVTVVFITMKFMGAGNQGMSQQQISADYAGKAPVYDWFPNITSIRARTADAPPAMVMVDISIGYEQGNKIVQSELVNRTPQIKDIVRQFFASRRTSDLTPGKENDLKVELAEKINSIMTDGKVRQVIFDNLTIIPGSE